MGENKRVISVNWVNTHLFQGTPTLISTLLPTDLSSSSEALRGVSVVTVRNSALASTAFHSNIEMTSPALQTGSALSNCGIKRKSFILCYKNTPQADTKKIELCFLSPAIELNPHLLTCLRVSIKSFCLVWLIQPSPYLGASMVCLRMPLFL